jgi:hypothetical protein
MNKVIINFLYTYFINNNWSDKILYNGNVWSVVINEVGDETFYLKFKYWTRSP